ncbi:MAG: hypothetical protein NZ822_01700 [Patescibacteria group bacterium]|nr:hypothetical protein [Patescibacteria group bacterium]
MKIEDIKVGKILDSRGEWTIEVEIVANNLFSKASVPSGKSRGSYEAKNRDYEEIIKNLDSFRKEVRKMDFLNSQEFDSFLRDRAGKNKEVLGANFILGLSVAFARLLAKVNNIDLFEYLKREYQLNTFLQPPRLVANVIGGGVHSMNNLDFQEYWLVSKSNFSEKVINDLLESLKKISERFSLPVGRNDEGAFCVNFNDNYEPFLYLQDLYDFEVGADIAANQITKLLDWKDVYEKLKALGVKFLEDPYRENEFKKFAELREMGFEVIGDDLTTTNYERLSIALEKNAISGVIVKPNQIGTIQETFQFIRLAKENNLFTIFSHRSGETNDDWIVDLGTAFNADYFKIGVPFQGERVAKWNRLLAIWGSNRFSDL